MALLCPIKAVFLQAFSTDGSYNLAEASSMVTLSLGLREYDTDVLFRIEHSVISYSLHVDQL